MSRGNSLIASVVLIGLMGSLAVALQASNPSVESEVQVAAVNTSSIQQVAAAVAPGTGLTCDPGYDYKIVETGKGKYEPVAIARDPELIKLCESIPEGLKLEVPSKVPERSASVEQEKNLASGGLIAKYKKKSPKCDEWKGQVEYCVPASLQGNKSATKEKCFPAKEMCIPGKTISPKAIREGMAPGVLKNEYLEALKAGDTERAAELKNVLTADPAIQKVADSFMGKDIAELDELSQQKTDQLNDVDKKLNDMLKKDNCASEPEYCIDLKNQQSALQKDQAELSKQIKDLKEAQTGLKPTVKTDEQGNPCPASGCSKAPPSNAGPDNSYKGAGNDTFGKGSPSGMPNQGQQKGGGGGQQPQNQTQQCQQGQYYSAQQNQYSYCSNGAIYTYNSYSCQYQVAQQCPYGCAQTSGTQSTSCATNPGQSGSAPTAQLTCGTGARDVGAKVTLNYTCGNGATKATASGFTITNETAMTGTAEVEIQKPPKGTNVVSYGLTCTGSNGQTTTNQCKVDINVTSMILVSNPQEVDKGEKGTLGWVTKGMKECHVSSEDFDDWTEENEDNDSVSGTVKTPTMNERAVFTLMCTTLGGAEKSIDLTVDIDA